MPALSVAERAAILRALPNADPGNGDATLVAAVVRHAETELGQRVRPRALDRRWAIEPPRRDVAREFAAARQAGRLDPWLADLSPPFPQYRRLLDARMRYAAILASGGWPVVPGGLSLRQGDSNDLVIQLRGRLAAEGYDSGGSVDSTVFDSALHETLAAFQAARGVEADGVLGPATRAALNAPVKDRLAQIDANVERLRWLPRALPADRFEVDSGGATATLFLGGRPALTMKAIVGDPKHPTPMFTSRIEAVIFNPPWNVPGSIAANELLPRERRSPGYLARNGFEVVGGQLRQRPGPKNALGVVKFDLPSPFGVYLHDTPGKAAFAGANRALSHGCMRLEKPRELAAALLAAQGVASESVDLAIASGRTQRVQLRKPVPIYVVHWTVTVEDGGRATFRPDVYGWDRKLGSALAGLRVATSDEGAARGTDCADG